MSFFCTFNSKNKQNLKKDTHPRNKKMSYHVIILMFSDWLTQESWCRSQTGAEGAPGGSLLGSSTHSLSSDGGAGQRGAAALVDGEGSGMNH